MRWTSHQRTQVSARDKAARDQVSARDKRVLVTTDYLVLTANNNYMQGLEILFLTGTVYGVTNLFVCLTGTVYGVANLFANAGGFIAPLLTGWLTNDGVSTNLPTCRKVLLQCINSR